MAPRVSSALETALAEKTQSLGITLTDRTTVLKTVLTEHSSRIDSRWSAFRRSKLSLACGRQNFEVNLGERKQLDSTV